MAISAAPFALKNLAAGLDAEQLRQAVASLVPNGGGIVQTGDLAVTAQSPAALGVNVGVGRAWLAGNNVANLTGQAYSTQGMYFALNDAPYPVALDTADSVNPRIDLIYIGATDSAYGGAADNIVISKVKGVPAASNPQVPATPKNSIALATVAVAANAATITAANITAATALGAIKPLAHVGRTSGFQTANPATIVMPAPQILRGGMTFDAPTNSLVPPIGGIYRVTIQGMFSGATTNGNIVKAQKNGGDIVVAVCAKPDGADQRAGASALVPLAAGDKINLLQASSASAWGTTGYDGSYLEVEYIGPA